MASGYSSAEEAVPPEASRWCQAFEAVMRRILADYQGTEVEVRNGMEKGMRSLFEKPYESELSTVLKVPVSLEEARRIVFFPRLSDMEVYKKTFDRETPEKSARREQLLKFKLMSIFYTLHRLDGALVDRFLHFGGLRSLVAMLGEENRIIQSQAMELLTEFLQPQMTLEAALSSRQKHLQHEVFLCLKSGALWKNLGSILSEPGEVFPRSHTSSIRLCAAAIGWLRPVDGAVPEAGAPPDVTSVVTAISGVLENGPGLAPDVRGMAEDLIEELVGVPTIRADPLSGAALSEAEKALFDKEAQAHEDAAHAWQALRKLGNEAFGSGLLWPAEAAYRLALEDGADALPEAEASLIASNRALALLKAGHYAEAAEAAGDALERDPRNAKAAYRRAQALLEQIGPEPGLGSLKLAQQAVAAAESASRLEPKDAKVSEMLEKARTRAKELDSADAKPEAESLEDMD
eukprot:TRINITY_DN94101_c0_g1_i1.p1 TRINITY_DN94101_c0_g1~~TRINITY_DN94101_c0_g1_i1.p1  ORF type:complete len:476 (+),score=130.17 TRINITY_DN94101_c0_g1_i1:43-1428(+)